MYSFKTTVKHVFLTLQTQSIGGPCKLPFFRGATIVGNRLATTLKLNLPSLMWREHTKGVGLGAHEVARNNYIHI